MHSACSLASMAPLNPPVGWLVLSHFTGKGAQRRVLVCPGSHSGHTRFKPSPASQPSAAPGWLTGLQVHSENMDGTGPGCVWRGQGVMGSEEHIQG